ncbi:MAG: hypothetical protein AAF518_25360 [Spirochaetota bacterium]
MKAPLNVKIESYDNRLIISYRWFALEYLWNIVVGGGYIYALIKFRDSWRDLFLKGGILMVCLGCAFLTFGIFMAYKILVTLFNKTSIILEPTHISVKHSPFSLAPVQSLSTTGIEKILIDDDYVTQAKAAVNVECCLYIVYQSGESRQMNLSIPSLEMANYIRYKLNRYLQLPERSLSPQEIERYKNAYLIELGKSFLSYGIFFSFLLYEFDYPYWYLIGIAPYYLYKLSKFFKLNSKNIPRDIQE